MFSQLFQWLQHLYNDWTAWALGLAAIVAGVSWIPGVGLALRAAIAGLEALSPIINSVFAGLTWIWSKVLLPGMLNILSQWSSIFTVLIMGGFLWIGLVARYEAKLISKSYVISKCNSPVNEPEPALDLPWPFKW